MLVLFLSFIFYLIINGNLKIRKIFLKSILVILFLFLAFQSSNFKTYAIKYALELEFDEKVKLEDFDFFERLIATRVGNELITPTLSKINQVFILVKDLECQLIF